MTLSRKYGLSAASVNRSTCRPRASDIFRSSVTSASKLLRLENSTIKSMSLCSFASPRAMEPKTPILETSFWRQISTSLLVSNGYVAISACLFFVNAVLRLRLGDSDPGLNSAPQFFANDASQSLFQVITFYGLPQSIID